MAKKRRLTRRTFLKNAGATTALYNPEAMIRAAVNPAHSTALPKEMSFISSVADQLQYDPLSSGLPLPNISWSYNLLPKDSAENAWRESSNPILGKESPHDVRTRSSGQRQSAVNGVLNYIIGQMSSNTPEGVQWRFYLQHEYLRQKLVDKQIDFKTFQAQAIEIENRSIHHYDTHIKPNHELAVAIEDPRNWMEFHPERPQILDAEGILSDREIIHDSLSRVAGASESLQKISSMPLDQVRKFVSFGGIDELAAKISSIPLTVSNYWDGVIIDSLDAYIKAVPKTLSNLKRNEDLKQKVEQLKNKKETPTTQDLNQESLMPMDAEMYLPTPGSGAGPRIMYSPAPMPGGAGKQTLAPGLYTRVEKLFNKEGVSKQDFTKLLVGEKNKPLVEKLWRLLKSGQSLSTEFAPTGSQQQAAAPSSQPAPSQSTIQTMGTYPKEVPSRMVGGSSQKILQKLERGLRLTLEEESRIREYVNKSDPSQIKPFIDRMAGAMGIAPFTVVKGYKGGQDKINDLTPQQMKSLVLRGLIQPRLEDDPRYRTELAGDYLGGPSPSKFDAPFQGPMPPPRYTDPMDNRRDVRAKDPVVERVEPEYGIPELGLKVPYQEMLREGYEESEVDHRRLKTYETALEKINDNLQKQAINKIREAAKEFALQSIPYEYRVLTKDSTYKRKLAKNDAEAAAAAEMFLDVVLGRNNNNFVPTGREHSTGRAFVGTKISTAKEFSPQRAREIVVGRQTTTPEHEAAREVLLDFQYGRLIPGEVAAEHSYLDNASTPLSRRDVIRELQIEALQEESIAANQNEELLGNIEINPSATEAINVFLNPLSGGGSIEDKVKSAEGLLTSKWDRITNQIIDQLGPILDYLLSQVPQKVYNKKTREYVYRTNPDLKKYKLLTRLYDTIQKTTGFELSAELLEQAIKDHGGFSDYYKYKNISGRNYFAGIDSQLLNNIDYNNFVADFVAEDGDPPRTDRERKNLRARPGQNQLKSLKDKLTKKIFAVTGYTKGKQTLPGERYKTVTYKDEKGKKRTRKEKFVKGGTNLLTKGDPIYGEEFKEALKEHLSTVILPGESGPRQALPSEYAKKFEIGLNRILPYAEDYIRESSRLPLSQEDVSFYDTQDESGFKEANYQAMQPEEMRSYDIKKETTARNKISKAIEKHNKTADASTRLDPNIVNQIYVIKIGRRFEIVQVDDVIGTNRLGTYSRVLKNLNEVIQRLLSIETATKPRSSQTSDLFPTEANVTYSEYGVPRINIAGMSLGAPAGALAHADPGDRPTVFVNENVIRDTNPQNLGAYPYGYSLSTSSAPTFAQLENPYQQNVGLGIPTQPGAQQNIRMTQGDSPLQTPEDYIRHIGAHEAAHMAFPTVRVSPEERSEGIVGGRQDMEQAIEQAAYGAVNPSAYDPMASVEAREGQTGLPESRLDAPPIYVDPYRPSYLPEQAYTQPLATPQAFTTGVSDITAGGQGLPVNQSTFAVNPSINLQAFDLDNLPPVDLSNVQQDNVFTYGGLDPTTDQTVQQDFVPGTTFQAQPVGQFPAYPEQFNEFNQPIDAGFIADVQTPESFIRQNVVGQAQPFDITLEDFDGAQDAVDTSNQSLIDRMKSGAKSAVGAAVGAGKKTVGAAKRTPGNVLNRINKIRASRGYKALNRIENIVMADELAELANAAWMEGEYRKGGDVLVGGKYVNNPVKEVVIGKDVNNFDELLTYLASANEDGVTEDGKTTGVAYLTEDEIRSLDSKRNKIVRDVQDGYYQSAQSHPLSKELYKDIAAYTADEDKPFGRTINILEPVDADRLASEDWSATAWDKISAGLGEYNVKSVSEPENLFPRDNLIYVPLLSNSQGRATSWAEVAQMGDAVAGFALTYKLPGGIKNKVLRNIPQRSLQGIGGADAAKSYSDLFAKSSYDNLGSGYLSRDESFTVRLREDVDASKFDKKKADEKLWDQIADSVPYTNLEFWSYDKEADTLTNRVSGTKVKPKDIGIPNYGEKLESFVKYRTEMEQLSLDYSYNPAAMREKENKIKDDYQAGGLAWSEKDLGYSYAEKRRAEERKINANVLAGEFGGPENPVYEVDDSVFEPKIDTITVHFDDDEYGNVELYDRRGKESRSGSWFIPSDAASTAGRVPTFGEVGIGQAGKRAAQTFYDLRNLIPGVNSYERDRKYYRVIGED